MDLSVFPPVAAVLSGLSSLVTALAEAAAPAAGEASWALAIVLFTALVRLVLLPLAISQVRAQLARRRLAPRVAELRRRIPNREALQRAILELYTAEKVSPLAGCLPTLAQAPVLTAVYSLFTHPVIAGSANTLLDHALWGMPLGANLVAALGAAVPVWPLLVLLVVLAALTELGRRAATGEGAPAPTAGLAAVTRVLPFVGLVFAALAPFAAALYLVTSAAWTVGERRLLRRVLA